MSVPNLKYNKTILIAEEYFKAIWSVLNFFIFRINNMEGFVKSEPLKEFENLSEVKTEPLDYNTEPFGKL